MAITSVRAVITDSAVTLTGEKTVDGVALVAGDIVLVAQPGTATNGPRVVGTGNWARHADYDIAAEFIPGMEFFVREGTLYARWNFQFKNSEAPATLDVTLLNFAPTSRGDVEKAGVGLVEDPPGTLRVPVQAGIAGGGPTYGADTLTFDSQGFLIDADRAHATETHIAGLTLSYVGAESVEVEAGEAWIPLAAGIRRLAGPDGPSFSASSVWHYAYFRESLGAPGVVFELNAPTTPYLGTATTATTFGTGYRYCGAFKTKSTSEPYNFTVEGDGNNLFVRYLEATSATPFRVLSAGAATAETSVSCAAVVPPTSRKAWVSITNNSAVTANLGVAGDSVTGGTTNPGIMNLIGGDQLHAWVELSDTQAFTYWMTSAPAGGTGLFVDVLGYVDRR